MKDIHELMHEIAAEMTATLKAMNEEERAELRKSLMEKTYRELMERLPLPTLMIQ